MPKTSSYNLCRNDIFEKRQMHSVCHGTELLSFLCPKIWNLVPVSGIETITLSESLDSQIKNKELGTLNIHADYVRPTYNK